MASSLNVRVQKKTKRKYDCQNNLHESISNKEQQRKINKIKVMECKNYRVLQ